MITPSYRREARIARLVINVSTLYNRVAKIHRILQIISSVLDMVVVSYIFIIKSRFMFVCVCVCVFVQLVIKY